MAGGGGGGPSFETTPSWVIGAVVFLIVFISLAVDKLLAYLGQRLKSKEKKPLYEALQKIKEELMLLGFISLLLAFLQDQVGKWCISEKLAKSWLPCHNETHTDNSTTSTTAHFQTTSSLLSNRGHRHLIEGIRTSSCSEGKVQFISLGVLHDLHYFIFILAVVHVFTCTLTVLLGEAKISQWKKWEESVSVKNHLHIDRKQNFIVVKSLTFIRERFKGLDAHKRNYVISFFKHLFGLVTKADYEAMRLGFILTHCNGDKRFNFHKYILYDYEADFKKVVSISWFLWLFAVISLTLNVAGSHVYLWISIIPLILLLVVGTKLQQVITELAINVAQRHSVVTGDVRIRPSDEYFWFNRPRIVLVLIHIILFLNSFGFAIFFWTLFEFGFNSCVMGEAKYVYPRIVSMVVVQTICSYSTLPLYAIVTQMGSSCDEEAMERSRHESSHAVTTHRVPEVSNATPSVEMANQLEKEGSQKFSHCGPDSVLEVVTIDQTNSSSQENL